MCEDCEVSSKNHKNATTPMHPNAVLDVWCLRQRCQRDRNVRQQQRLQHFKMAAPVLHSTMSMTRLAMTRKQRKCFSQGFWAKGATNMFHNKKHTECWTMSRTSAQSCAIMQKFDGTTCASVLTLQHSQQHQFNSTPHYISPPPWANKHDISSRNTNIHRLLSTWRLAK